MNRLSSAVLVLLVAASLPLRGEEHGCCHGCGNHCRLKPVCRLVCEPKTIVEVVYDCRCEDFCTPGPSKKCGEVCETDCCGHQHKRIVWQPSCGKVRHRHVLLKHECEKQVPHYKCVVEYVCDRCSCCDGRVPCDQASHLSMQAGQMNAAAEKGIAPADSKPPASEARRNLLWPISWGK
jgi:hypothetical protein